jgi:hypothetical protein
MPRFLIEIAHEAEKVACAKAVHLLMTTGSHWLTHADWGCTDGVHKGWVTVEVDSKDEARRILPPRYRNQADIVQLNKFGLEELENLIGYHQPKR